MESLKKSIEIEPAYKNSPDYQNMMWLLLDKKNLGAFRSILIDTVREHPESFTGTFQSKIDIFEQVLDGTVKEEELGKRNYPPELLAFAKSLVEELFSVSFSDSDKYNK